MCQASLPRMPPQLMTKNLNIRTHNMWKKLARSSSFGCDTVAYVNALALRCVGEGIPRTKSLTPEGMGTPTDPNDA